MLFLGLVSVKDETQDPTTACRNASTYFSSDKKFVGVVGSYSSECALSFQDQLKVLSKYVFFINNRCCYIWRGYFCLTVARENKDHYCSKN